MFVNPGSKTDDELWLMDMATSGRYPPPANAGSAVRETETWETMFLPFGWWPCPGESDFSTTFSFMRGSKDSLLSNPQKTLRGRDAISDLVFDPKVDGDVLAAAVMRTINRMNRLEKAGKMMNRKGGAK